MMIRQFDVYSAILMLSIRKISDQSVANATISVVREISLLFCRKWYVLLFLLRVEHYIMVTFWFSVGLLSVALKVYTFVRCQFITTGNWIGCGEDQRFVANRKDRIKIFHTFE